MPSGLTRIGKYAIIVTAITEDVTDEKIVVLPKL